MSLTFSVKWPTRMAIAGVLLMLVAALCTPNLKLRPSIEEELLRNPDRRAEILAHRRQVLFCKVGACTGLGLFGAGLLGLVLGWILAARAQKRGEIGE